MASQVETDAEDVNDFLLRIKELGQKRDQEDEERNRKLEEEILQGRKERQARRGQYTITPADGTQNDYIQTEWPLACMP